MQAWVWTIVSLIIVSGISLIGIFFMALSKYRLKGLLLYMVSFAVGGLFGDAFFELVPEAYERIGPGMKVPILIMAGLLAFFILEKFLRWRHCHVPTSRKHPHPVVFMNIIGDAAHNFTDGLVIGASYMVSFPIGLATTTAVILHEIPHEIGNFGILVHGGLKPFRALFYNFLTSLAALAGGIVALLVSTLYLDFAHFLLPLTAGGFLYIAGSDLIPELHGEEGCRLTGWNAFWQLVLIAAGMALMAGLVLFEPH